MAAAVGPLRASARAVLSGRSAALRQLAALDAVLDQALAAREASLLATVPVLLGKRFVQLDAGGIEHGVDLAKAGVVLADPAQLVPHLL